MQRHDPWFGPQLSVPVPQPSLSMSLAEPHPPASGDPSPNAHDESVPIDCTITAGEYLQRHDETPR